MTGNAACEAGAAGAHATVSDFREAMWGVLQQDHSLGRLVVQRSSGCSVCAASFEVAIRDVTGD